MFKALKMFIVLLLMSFFVMVSSSAFAKGFFLNTSIGTAQLDDIEGIGFDNGITFSLGAGYFLNEYFGVEVDYLTIGDMEDEILSLVTLSGDAFTVSAVGKYNFSEKFTAYAKAGLNFWNLEVTADGYGKETEDGTDLTFAFGGMFNFNQNLSTFLQYQWLTFESGGENVDMDSFSLGLQYHF